MIRSAVATASALVFVCSLAAAPGAFAQASKTPNATPATAKPASSPALAKFIPPVKGKATIEMIQGKPQKIGNDLVTILKVKNMSSGSIALLTVDEYWYNKKREITTEGTTKVKQLIRPGEIVDVKSVVPYKTDIDRNTYRFSHANGTIDVKPVKKFAE